MRDEAHKKRTHKTHLHDLAGLFEMKIENQ